jgi:hypothetical protein
MPNTDSAVVALPHGVISDVRVIFDKGPQDRSWSVARVNFDGDEAVAIRWQTADAVEPSADSLSTWFIVPQEIADSVIRSTYRLLQNDEEAMRLGYEAIAADEESEAEAMDWIETHAGECL